MPTTTRRSTVVSSSHPIRHGRFLRRVRRQQHVNSPVLSPIILQYSSAADDLRPWFWPITEDFDRVLPSALVEHRMTHMFQAPSCLCAYGSAENSYFECAIYVAPDGPFFGEYVAGCRNDHCGYIVCLERVYPRLGLYVKKYPVRPADSAVALINYQPLKLLDARLVSALPTMPVVGLRECVTDRLLRLDDEENPGLIESEFRRLFTQCRCGKIMTRRVFKNHTCTVVILMRQNVVIDLTADAEDVVDLTSDA